MHGSPLVCGKPQMGYTQVYIIIHLQPQGPSLSPRSESSCAKAVAWQMRHFCMSITLTMYSASHAATAVRRKLSVFVVRLP